MPPILKEAHHLLASVRAGAKILGTEKADSLLTVKFSGDSAAIYNCSDLHLLEIEPGSDFRIESLAGQLDYSSGDELLQVATDEKAIYFFLSDGTALSCTYRNTRPTMLSVFDPGHFLKKPGLKVLDIGNSYTDDALSMVPDIVAATQTDVSDMCLYKLIRGGSSFRSWTHNFHGHDADVCNMTRVVGGLPVSCIEGNGAPYNKTLMNSVLTDESWDLILIHQLSNYAPYYFTWNNDSDAGGLDEFVSILRDTQPQAAIGILLVHSYMDNFEGNMEKTSMARWQKIASSTSAFCADYGVGYVIPYGTAVENLRQHDHNTEHDKAWGSANGHKVGYTRDGRHLGVGLGRYSASCCYYEALFEPRTGISVKGCGLRYVCPPDITIFKYPEGCVDVTDENAGFAERAAIEAVRNKFELTEL